MNTHQQTLDYSFETLKHTKMSLSERMVISRSYIWHKNAICNTNRVMRPKCMWKAIQSKPITATLGTSHKWILWRPYGPPIDILIPMHNMTRGYKKVEFILQVELIYRWSLEQVRLYMTLRDTRNAFCSNAFLKSKQMQLVFSSARIFRSTELMLWSMMVSSSAACLLQSTSSQ